MLSRADVEAFWQHGHLGPFPAAGAGVAGLPAAAARSGLRNHGDGSPVPHPSEWSRTGARHINVHDPHLRSPEFHALCSHPSIVTRVGQILGCTEIALFQTRFRVKFPEREDPVPWHQDVGEANGGYRADGTPVPSVTVWLSVDGADTTSGCLRVVPGTHRTLLGDWRAGFHSRLEERGELVAVDTSRSVPLPTAPGEFHLLHSWTLHVSTANATRSARTGVVMRFVAPDDAVQPGTRYTKLVVR